MSEETKTEAQADIKMDDAPVASTSETAAAPSATEEKSETTAAAPQEELPKVDGKSDEEVQSLLAKSAKQSESTNLARARARARATATVLRLLPYIVLLLTHSLLLLLRLESPYRQVLFLPDRLQPRRLGTHQDDPHFQANARVPGIRRRIHRRSSQAGNQQGRQRPTRVS
jgi:hypothetical protein